MNRVFKFLTVCSALVLILAVVLSNPVIASPKKSHTQNRTGLAKPATLDQTQFDGNSIACWMQNHGLIVSHKVTGSSGMEWPKGTGKLIDYASGLWIAGRLGDEIRTACVEYSPETQPGKILPDGTADNWDLGKYRFYKINSDGSGDWDTWPVEDGAPVDADGKPLLMGDQTIWFVTNDLNAADHTNVFKTQPMGLEIQITVFGFNQANPLGNIMFLQWKIINRSTNDYDSCYVACWDDPDLGDASDDLVGCDTTLSMGYCYNGSPVDADYGTTPPAVGFDFFQGPENPMGSGNYMPMTSFAYYYNGAPDPFDDPETAEEAYWFMNGYAGDGTPFTDHLGNETRFVFAGDPVSGSGHLDSNPGDRRFLMSSGPFQLAAGDTQIVMGAKIIAPGTDNLSAIAALRYFDSFAQNAYDNNFDLPSPPAPKVETIELDQEVVLTWQEDYKQVEDYNYSGYTFEGYNVYQGQSVSGPWRRLATYDVVNDYGIIFDKEFDAARGMVLEVPVQFGANTGITRNLSITTDVFNQVELANYKTYYFAVTCYAVNPDVAPKTVESAKTAIEVMPQAPALGTKYNEMVDSTITVTHTGGSDGTVSPLVVDPGAITGHNYEVTFDTLAGGYVWNLTDLTDNEVVLANQTNQSGDENYQIVDGMKVYVAGPPLAIKDWDYDGTRWISGTNWGGSHMFGGLDLGLYFFGSTLSGADLVPVEVRFFADTTAGPEDGWASRGYTYRRDLGYVFGGIGYLPFAAYDITDPANPRQVNICFVEDASAGNANLRWDMGGMAADGGREYTFIMLSDYNPDGDLYNDTVDGTCADVLYAFWPSTRGSHPYLEADFTMTILPNYINTETDVFTFSTKAATVSTAVSKANIAKINVVPNPYFAFNPMERKGTTRLVTFTNLAGSKTTIRIFNLAGDLLHVIDDTERGTQGTLDTPYAYWYLRNQADVPVASGMYIAHIEVENVGAKILKFAVFMPEERLDRF